MADGVFVEMLSRWELMRSTVAEHEPDPLKRLSAEFAQLGSRIEVDPILRGGVRLAYDYQAPPWYAKNYLALGHRLSEDRFREAQRRGLIRRDVDIEAAARQVLVILVGNRVLQALERREVRLDEYLHESLEFLLASVRNSSSR